MILFYLPLPDMSEVRSWSHIFKKNVKILWFQLLKCEYFQFSTLFYDSKWNTFEFRTEQRHLRASSLALGNADERFLWQIKGKNNQQMLPMTSLIRLAAFPRCIVKITGDMTLSFPTGIIKVFTNNPSPAVLTFKLKNTSRLEQILPNQQLLYRWDVAP